MRVRYTATKRENRSDLTMNFTATCKRKRTRNEVDWPDQFIFNFLNKSSHHLKPLTLKQE